MAKLTTKARKDLPSKDFAGPHKSFPITDKGHAEAALREIKHAPPADRAKIRAKAEKMLHKKGR